jgi:hypothetical protein
MAEAPRRTSSSLLASIVGWVLVAVLAYWALGALVGTVRFLFKFLLWIAIIVGLLFLYLKLKFGDDD